MSIPSIQEIQKRTQRVWFDDGLWELGFGCILLLIGLAGLVEWRFRPQGSIGLFFGLFQMGIIIGGFFALGRILRWFKERITYPRIGYAAYRKATGSNKIRRILTSFLTAALIGGLIAMLASLRQTEAYLPVICAAVMALSAFYIGMRFGITRFIVVSVLIVLLGAGVSYLRLGSDLDIAVFFSGLGLLWILSGGSTLGIFLRSTPPAGAENLTAEEQ